MKDVPAGIPEAPGKIIANILRGVSAGILNDSEISWWISGGFPAGKYLEESLE